jgi:hypothetical protein
MSVQKGNGPTPDVGRTGSATEALLMPNGSYDTERECSHCGYLTWNRDAFWEHFFREHDGEAA